MDQEFQVGLGPGAAAENESLASVVGKRASSIEGRRRPRPSRVVKPGRSAVERLIGPDDPKIPGFASAAVVVTPSHPERQTVQSLTAEMGDSREPIRVEIEGNRPDAGSEQCGFAADADQPSGVGPDVVEDGFEFAGVVGIRGAVGLDFDGDSA